MKKTIILLAFVTCLFSLNAQQKLAKDTVGVNLNTVNVNAYRNKLYSEMGRIVTVLDKQDIQRSAVQSIDQLLDYVAGVDIRQRGVNTTQADISIRGGSFDQVLVLLNGINITDPQTGHFNLDLPINISDVNRIEILQGSASRVLGPNAFSGAINIITDSYDSKKLNAEFTGGSYNTFGQSISGNLGDKAFHTFASVSHKSSSGYLSNTDFDLSNVFVQSVINTTHAGKFNLQLSGQLKDMGENGYYSLKYPNQREANKTFFTALDWSHTAGKFTFNAQTSWRKHYDRYELIHSTPSGYKYHLTDVVSGNLNASYSSVLGKTTVGLLARNEHIYSNSLGNTMSNNDSVANPFESGIYFKKAYNRTIYSGTFDHSVRFGKWYASAGLASSYSNDFKWTTYGGFDLGYFITEDVKIYGSANSASRLPTFTDLFFANPVNQGNPNLKPEQSQTAELGTKINKSAWSVNADVYYRLGKNVIDWVKTESTQTKYVSMNLSKVNAFGVDVSGEYRFANSFIKLFNVAYSYMKLDKPVVVYQSKYALDYLRHKLTTSVNHTIYDKLSGTWTVSYADRLGTYDAQTSTTGSAITTKYTPYTLLGCRLLWKDKKFDIYADANNILNSQYADYGGLNQPGFNWNIGFRLKL